MTTDEMIEALDDAGRLMNDELGEYWVALAQLASAGRFGTSKGFEAALEKEVLRQHNRLRREFRLVEKEVTHTYTEQRLVHYSEEG